jgi:hypothetical protein
MNLVKIVAAGRLPTSLSTLGRIAGSHSTAQGPGGMNISCMSTQIWMALADIGLSSLKAQPSGSGAFARRFPVRNFRQCMPLWTSRSLVCR